MPFGILAPSRQKHIIIILQSTGTNLNNPQEKDVSQRRLAWNFNIKITTRKTAV